MATKTAVKPKKKFKDILVKLCDKNPALEDNLMYLLVEIWDVQGLKLYPIQREKFLSGDLTTPETIGRELRKQRIRSAEAKLLKKRRF